MGWGVSIFRFSHAIFDGVLTTASITIVDKRQKGNNWAFFDISRSLQVKPRRSISGSKLSILKYSDRGHVWARRGISPGGQKVFTLTEAERVQASLTRRDVIPCV